MNVEMTARVTARQSFVFFLNVITAMSNHDNLRSNPDNVRLPLRV